MYLCGTFVTAKKMYFPFKIFYPLFPHLKEKHFFAAFFQPRVYMLTVMECTQAPTGDLKANYSYVAK